MIEQIENRRKNDKNTDILNNLQLKGQNKMDLTVIHEEDEARVFEGDEDNENGTTQKQRKNKKNFMKEFHKIMEMSDIILEVLDARDPESCRCREAELLISGMKGEKKLIFVLNKIDMVPLPIVYAWKQHLEKEYAVVLLKSNTQRQTTNYGENRLFQNSVKKNPELVDDMIKSGKSLGTHKLLELIKNYSREGNTKKAVTVGVIGYPNVGKSSVINSLKRKRAAAVSSKAGFTKNLQEIEIDSKVKIVDSPGVILSNESEAVMILRNQINAAEVKDPITPIASIIERVNKRELQGIYKIPYFEDSITFLYSVAQSKGKLKKVH
jgi:nuclear GTP-binding protein